ncbi:MAG: hypothetical protein GYB33_19060 [Gammaproteobacteria bacterium]|nr:hypothetical protein [Gammaproteobacteria bacterium]
MGQSEVSDFLPPRLNTAAGAQRRVGIEIEMAGIEADAIARCLQVEFGGSIERHTRYELSVTGTEFGDFSLELDSDFFKELEQDSGGQLSKLIGGSDVVAEIENISADVVAAAAEQFVPWEIVSPPIAIAQLEKFAAITGELRALGAKGTRHAARFAFGVHLNPELPDLDAGTILRYLQAYVCLYDWIVAREKIDLSRRLTPYIKHFKRSYIQQIIDPGYQPDLATLIDDYLDANPTRNRSLDMLPLFAHLDEQRVRAVVQDSRVKGRPTLHYRLPNCDIDNPHWTLLTPWYHWLQVEYLANDSEQLATICQAYQQELTRLGSRLDDKWLAQCQSWVES